MKFYNMSDRLFYESDNNDVDLVLTQIDQGEKTESFSVEYLKQADYEYLSNLDFDLMPLDLKAAITDIMWLKFQDYHAAEVAVASYRELYLSLFDEKKWKNSFFAISRALIISYQSSTDDLVYQSCCDLALNAAETLDDADQLYFSLSILRLFISQKYVVTERLMSACEAVLERTKKGKNISLTIEAYKLKIELLKLQGQDVAECTLDLKTYCDNRSAQEHLIVDECLVEIGQRLDKLSFQRSLIYLAELTEFFSENQLKKVKTLELHIFQRCSDFANMNGEVILKYALNKIRLKHKFEKKDIIFLVRNNPLIPEGREEIFLSAFNLGLKGDINGALHILAPQIEHLSRHISAGVKGVSINLDNPKVVKSRAISTMFNLPKIEGSDEDIQLLFHILINESAGVNIRKRIAAGIMTDQEAEKGMGIYFFCAVLKLCSCTSPGSCRVIKNWDDQDENELITRGVIRNFDDLGRIVIPKEYRDELKIDIGDALEIYRTDKGIIVKKDEPENRDEMAVLLEEISLKMTYKSNHRNTEAVKRIVEQIDEIRSSLEAK